MSRAYYFPAIVAALLTYQAAIMTGEAGDSQPAVTVAWSDMEQFFQPPEQYKGELGKYRSVMVFDDGTPLKSPQDWPRRRAEILKYWHGAMGQWPSLIEKPRIKYEGKEHVENFTRYKVELEVAPGRFVGGQYLLVPDGQGPFPAVLATYYTAAASARASAKTGNMRDYGYELAKRGFVTLCIGGQDVGDYADSNVRKPTPSVPVQPISYLAYVAANCCNALAGLPEVDAKRIGVVGQSYGGKWAMFASCLYDKFACGAWSDPGIVWNEQDGNANYWDKWYLGYQFDKPADQQRKPGIGEIPRTGAYKKLVEEGRDLNELHALMAPRPFLVSGGKQDQIEHWPAVNGAIALYKFLGYNDCVAMTNRVGHSPTPESNAQIVAFFEHFLKPVDKLSSRPKTTSCFAGGNRPHPLPLSQRERGVIVGWPPTTSCRTARAAYFMKISCATSDERPIGRRDPPNSGGK